MSYRKTVVVARVTDQEGFGRGERIGRLETVEDGVATPPFTIPELAPGEGVRVTLTVFNLLPETDGSRLHAAMKEFTESNDYLRLDMGWSSLPPELRAKYEEWAAMVRQ